MRRRIAKAELAGRAIVRDGHQRRLVGEKEGARRAGSGVDDNGKDGRLVELRLGRGAARVELEARGGTRWGGALLVRARVKVARIQRSDAKSLLDHRLAGERLRVGEDGLRAHDHVAHARVA